LTKIATQLDDIELLEHIKESNDAFAYKEFVDRFYTVVRDECITKCKLRKIDPHVGEQIAHETFERVKKSNSFDKSRLNGADSRSAIIGWLYKISCNLFYDYHNSKKNAETKKYSYFDELLNETSEINTGSLEETREIAIMVLNKLNPKEREVIITDLEYKRLRKYLPQDVNESLAARIGVKKESIRKIRERAVKKLKNAIDEINK
jgi:RNA polymerase sigma factor (sigma-70 family)